MADSYFGGKGQTFRKLINEIPPHDVFISSHCGMCAVARHKRPARRNILIDLDQFVLEQMRASLAECVPSAARATQGAYENDDGASLPTGPGLRAGEASGAGSGTSSANAANCRWEFLQTDGLAWLRSRTTWEGNEFVYCDPPYVWNARSSLERGYEHEYSLEDHQQLLGVIKSLPCRVMISGYWSELYEEELSDWRTISSQTMTRGGRPRTEYAWMNYDEPVELHDYRWLGENYRERERIKRKQQRWRERLKQMPILERRAMLAVMNEVW